MKKDIKDTVSKIYAGMGFTGVDGPDFGVTDDKDDLVRGPEGSYTGKTYVGYVMPDNLLDGEIAVFGSNEEGRHGKGTALICKQHFGAKYGQASGLQGRSYGIVTTDLRVSRRPSVSSKRVKGEIKDLYEFAEKNPQYVFKIMYAGRTANNLSGFSNEQFASYFSKYLIPQNICFEKEFSTLLTPVQ